MNKEMTVEDRRNELAVKVFHDLAVSGRELPVVKEDGSRPIVVALDEELLTAVAGRIMDSGGAANLFVELQNGDVVLLSSVEGIRTAEHPRSEIFSREPMHETVTIGIMAEYVSKAPDSVIVTVRLPKFDADMQYVDRRELEDA